MSKNVIFVETGNQLINAILIKSSLYENDSFDLAIFDSKYCGHTVNYEKLNTIFDRIIKYDYTTIKTIIRGILLRLFPRVLLRISSKDELLKYDSVFFYNPSDFLLAYLKELYKEGLKINLHVFQDSMGHYYYSRKYTDVCSRSFEKASIGIDCLNFDLYIIKPEYIEDDPFENIIEIPVQKKKNQLKELIPPVFKVNFSKGLKHRYVFLDVLHERCFGNSNQGIEIIGKLGSIIGKDNIVIKPHPAQDISVYSDLGIDVIKEPFPWELYCINHDVDDMVFVTFGTDSAFMPSIMLECRPTIICINTNTEWGEMVMRNYMKTIEKMQRELDNKVYIANDINEFSQIYRSIERGEK